MMRDCAGLKAQCHGHCFVYLLGCSSPPAFGPLHAHHCHHYPLLLLSALHSSLNMDVASVSNGTSTICRYIACCMTVRVTHSRRFIQMKELSLKAAADRQQDHCIKTLTKSICCAMHRTVCNCINRSHI